MSYLKIIRPFNLLLIFATQYIIKIGLGFIEMIELYDAQLSIIDFLLLATATICIAAGGYVINDVFDVKTDRINKPKEIYITTIISKKNGVIYYSILTITGILSGCLLAYSKDLFSYAWLFIGTASLLFVYTWKLQKIALIGNLCTSILVGFSLYIVWLFGASESIYLPPLFLSIVILSISLTLIREIIKDTQDMKGDYANGYKTLPILLGTNRTLSICSFLSMATLFFVSYFTFTYFKGKYAFIAVIIISVVIPLAIVASKCWNASTTKDFKNIARLLKFIMFIGILLVPILLYLQYNA